MKQLRYFLKFAFNGTNYHGWQMQNNSISVQEVIDEGLSRLLREKINVCGAGRTDTGVHAKEFFAHFDTSNVFSVDERKNLVNRLNKYYPDDIAIEDLIPVIPTAHARFDAISRTYKYFITQKKDPFGKEFSFLLFGEIDLNLMNEGAKLLFDYSDFSSFSKADTQVKTNNCKIMSAEWTEENETLVFTIKADRFLRNMVRAIVGTLLDIGRKRISLYDFNEIIKSKNRSEAGYSVPGLGLFLYKIEYPDNIFLEPYKAYKNI
jgi:tRNA pseudouridine38-40 synthase